MRRPSVLFINRVYPPSRGATGRVLRDLARSFAREGWQVTVVTTGPKAMRERDGGVRVIRIKASQNPGMFGYIKIWLMMMFTALRLPSFHLFVTLSDPPLLVLIGQMVKVFKGSRHIHWCHDLYPDIFPVLNYSFPRIVLRFLKRRTLKAMREADKVIVIGRCMARNLTYDGIDPRHITMIPNWPDEELSLKGDGKTQDNAPQHDSFSDHPSQNADDDADDIYLNGMPQTPDQGQQALAHKPDASSDGGVQKMNGSKPYEDQLKTEPKFRVLYAGNIGRAHPMDTILGAAEILIESNPEIEFVFVGDGAGFDKLANDRARYHLDNIRLLPFQPSNRLRETMESGDLHIVSVKDEAAGLLVPSKVYSALAVQRPCIFVGPHNSEAAKVINDFKAGTIVPQRQPEALADAIRAYRMSGELWFEAHEGALKAAQIYVPSEAINAWMERAWTVVRHDLER